jgi:hypothetical protein
MLDSRTRFPGVFSPDERPKADVRKFREGGVPDAASPHISPAEWVANHSAMNSIASRLWGAVPEALAELIAPTVCSTAVVSTKVIHPGKR